MARPVKASPEAGVEGWGGYVTEKAGAGEYQAAKAALLASLPQHWLRRP